MPFDDFTLRAQDGTQLFARSCTPEGSPVAHILIYHGYGEHLGRYDEVMEWFAAEEQGLLDGSPQGGCQAASPYGFGFNWMVLLAFVGYTRRKPIQKPLAARVH